MIKFAFERICFMQFAFDECKFFLASSHPYLEETLVSGLIGINLSNDDKRSVLPYGLDKNLI